MPTPSDSGRMLQVVADAMPMDAGSAGIAAAELEDLWRAADGSAIGLTVAELGAALAGAARKYGVTGAEGTAPLLGFYRALHLKELALAQACALGRDAAWQRFMDGYRAALTQAASAITGSATEGEDLAGALYAELFGLKERDGGRVSPFASYSGRGSLLGWLRAMLAQRHVDRFRRTHWETAMPERDFAAATPEPAPRNADLVRLGSGLATVLGALDAQDRLLLASYFLDGRKLHELARLLRVHEATVSRRLKRLTGELRKQLLGRLQSGGMSRRAAEELLGTDPRDLEVNLRSLLQTSQAQPFSEQAGRR